MRKLILIIVALIFGTAVGLGSSELWLRARTLPYCTVAKNAESYHMRYVRVRARIFLGTDGMYVHEDCDPVEALAAAVELEGDHSATGIGYVDELLVSGTRPQVKVADAVIEGEFNAHFSPGCWGPKYHISARNIHLLSPVQNYEPPQTNEEGLRVKH